VVFLAQGFEELEAVAVIDVLRRAELAVTVVAVGGGMVVTGSHGISITADITENELDCAAPDAIVLPGGLPGTTNLEKSPIVQKAIDDAVCKGTWICAICAAPSILGHKNLLKGRDATCFPGHEQALDGAYISENAVVADRPFITGKGAGVAVDFALEIVAALCSPERANRLRGIMQCV